MGNEQQSGTSHHFIARSSNEQLKRSRIGWTKNGRLPISKQPSIPAKSSWQLARDVSMDLLSRKTPRLSSKQG